MKGTVFVASPSATGRMPLASGSRVPAWPALAAPVARRTRLTTCIEVSPTGLSMTSQPWIGVPRCLRATSAVRVAAIVVVVVVEIGHDAWIMQQLLDASGVIKAAIGL